jgi:hypothetical protein
MAGVMDRLRCVYLTACTPPPVEPVALPHLARENGFEIVDA